MFRSRMLVCIAMLAAFVTIGCEAKKPQDDQAPPQDQGDYATLSPADSDPFDATYDEPMGPAVTRGTEIERSSSSGGQTHVVRKQETLFSLARTYYNGDASKWKLIYEANRERIKDPNVITVGQKLIIPPM